MSFFKYTLIGSMFVIICLSVYTKAVTYDKLIAEQKKPTISYGCVKGVRVVHIKIENEYTSIYERTIDDKLISCSEK